MRHALFALTLLAVLPVHATAQQRPDFSGTWTLPPDAPVGPSGKPTFAPGYGPTINIRQDASTLTISRTMGTTIVHVTHPLDGSESRSRTPGRLCEGDSQSIWTAAWQDDTILTTMVGSLPAGAAEPTKMNVKTTFRLQSPDTMSVAVTFQNAAMTEPRTVTAVYKKTGPPAETPAPAAPSTVQAKVSQLDWLGGTWVGTTPTTIFEERWTPPGGGSILAINRTIRQGVMTAFEFLCVVERNGGLVYQAMPNGRMPATDFTLTKMDGKSLTFENPAHDFPKKIEYRLDEEGTLHATASGTEKEKPLRWRYKKQ